MPSPAVRKAKTRHLLQDVPEKLSRRSLAFVGRQQLKPAQDGLGIADVSAVVGVCSLDCDRRGVVVAGKLSYHDERLGLAWRNPTHGRDVVADEVRFVAAHA